MKRSPVKLVGAIPLAVTAILFLLPACGVSAGNPSLVPTIPQATTKPQANPTPAPAAITDPMPPVGTLPTPQPVGVSSDTLLTQGKLIFDTNAGGVGCAYCHGLDGKGKGTSGVGATDIRGATETRVRGAIMGGVPAMSFIKLSDKDMTAVVAYLQRLNK